MTIRDIILRAYRESGWSPDDEPEVIDVAVHAAEQAVATVARVSASLPPSRRESARLLALAALSVHARDEAARGAKAVLRDSCN